MAKTSDFVRNCGFSLHQAVTSSRPLSVTHRSATTVEPATGLDGLTDRCVTAAAAVVDVPRQRNLLQPAFSLAPLLLQRLSLFKTAL